MRGGRTDLDMARRAARVDDNQTGIVLALRGHGCTVQSLAPVGAGCPDLLVGYRGANYLLEVKQPRGQMTPAQVEWHTLWAGSVHVVTSPREALAAIGFRV